MHKQRRTMIVTLLILFAIFNTGCTTTYLELKSWEGRKLSDLYFEWGKADEVTSERKFYKVHTWLSKGKDGKEKSCRKSFYTKYDGHAETIVDTKYENCIFLTIK